MYLKDCRTGHGHRRLHPCVVAEWGCGPFYRAVGLDFPGVIPQRSDARAGLMHLDNGLPCYGYRSHGASVVLERVRGPCHRATRIDSARVVEQRSHTGTRLVHLDDRVTTNSDGWIDPIVILETRCGP